MYQQSNKSIEKDDVDYFYFYAYYYFFNFFFLHWLIILLSNTCFFFIDCSSPSNFITISKMTMVTLINFFFFFELWIRDSKYTTIKIH